MVHPEHFVEGGGLLSYGPDYLDQFRRVAATSIASSRERNRLAPTKYQLVINLKAAKALGLEVPLYLQQLADELIE